MRGIRFRLVLPIVLGCVAIALMVWEFHNEHVIEAMGMGWDTGPPVWPYETSWILLQAINAPAYFLDSPLFMLLGLKSGQAQLLLEFPTILLWWWFIGWRIDFGLLPRRHVRHSKVYAFALGGISVGFSYFVAHLIVNQVRFWFEYGHIFWKGQAILLLRNAGILGWCLLLGFWSTAAALRFALSTQDVGDSDGSQ